MARVRVVLVRPEHPANIGASARTVRNSGLEGLDLVTPAEWRTVECWRTAWGATDVLDQAVVHTSLAKAVGSAAYVVGFSRRVRGAERVPLDVRDVAAEIAALPASAAVAVVFGPETSGLTLDELALCGRTAMIPTAPAQPSLNLSHAVAVAAYEIYRTLETLHDRGARAARVASHAEKEDALGLFIAGLEALHTVSKPRRRIYVRLWRGLLQRVDLTPAEVRMIAHLGRRLARAGGRTAATSAEGLAAATAVTAPAPAAQPFADVRLSGEGFSIPLRKWRELLFTGALARDGVDYVRDPSRPLPPFVLEGLFPEGARFEATIADGRVMLRRRGS